MLLEVMTTRKKCTYDLNGPCERNRAVEKENILDREIEFTKREQRERETDRKGDKSDGKEMEQVGVRTWTLLLY